MTDVETRLSDLERRVDRLEGKPEPDKGPRTMLGVGFPTYWSHEDAFINHAVLAGRDFDAHVASGYVGPDGASYIAVPARGGVVIGLVRDGTEEAPDYYAGKWILDWEGDGEVAFSGGHTGKVETVGANRLEETFDPAIHGHKPPRLSVVRAGPGGVRNIRYFRADHEALLKAGEIVEPKWKRKAARFDALRTMDWSGVNATRAITVAELASSSRPFWFGEVPVEIQVRAAAETGTALWLTVAPLLGFTPAARDALFAKDLTQQQRLEAIKAEAPAIFAQMDREFLAYARRVVAAMKAYGYPPDRLLRLELGNEIWNFTNNRNTAAYWGLGLHLAEAVGLRDNMRSAYGWISAIVQRAFDAALTEAGRSAQPVRSILAAHTANVSRTEDALKGAAANGAEMGRVGVATTHYYSGGFKWHRDNRLFGEKIASPDEWDARWLERLAASRGSLMQAITDYHLDAEPMFANVAWIIDAANKHKAVAETFGASFEGTYEGDSHNTMSDALRANPEAVSVFLEWHESQGHGDTIRAVAAGLRSISPETIMANFHYLAGGRGTGQPWIEGAPWDETGEDNEAWEELLKAEGN